MKKLRFVLAVLIAGTALTTGSLRAEDMPEDCDCWYWQSNQYGIIDKGQCEVRHCAPPVN